MYYERVNAVMARRGAPAQIEKATVGDIIMAVLAIKDEDIARSFFLSYVDYLVDRIDSDPTWITAHDGIPAELTTTRQQAIWLAQQNIGWCYGEGMTQEQIDIWVGATTEGNSRAEHPGFGITLPDGSTRSFMNLLTKGMEMGRAGQSPWKGK